MDLEFRRLLAALESVMKQAYVRERLHAAGEVEDLREGVEHKDMLVVGVRGHLVQLLWAAQRVSARYASEVPVLHRHIHSHTPILGTLTTRT